MKNCSPIIAVRIALPLGDNPKLPLSATAGANDVIRQAGASPARTPATIAVAAERPSTCRLPKGFMPATVSWFISVCDSSNNPPTAIMNAVKAIPAASAVRYRRSDDCVAPRIFCVFMLRTRIGISALEKLAKLMAAISRISKAIDSRIFSFDAFICSPTRMKSLL